MIGAIIGDMVGAPYEFNENNIKTTDFPLFNEKSIYTDDSILTCAIANACVVAGKSGEDYFRQECIKQLYVIGNEFTGPEGGYGPRFLNWLLTDFDKLEPIGSYGNGSAMRVSPVAWYFDDIDSVLKYAKISAEVTHNHEEGIKGAQAIAAAIYLARTSHDKNAIANYIKINFGYDLNKSLDSIRPTYRMDATCQGSVPQAIRAFLEGNTFEQCIRLAVSIGGDSDTIACMTGSIAEAYYHIPKWILNRTISILSKAPTLINSYTRFIPYMN